MDVVTLDARRRAVLDQMLDIRSMRQGSVSEQYVSRPRKGQRRAGRLGPYYVACRYTGTRYVSRRLRSPEDVAHAYQAVANRKRFLALCKEFEELTEQLGDLERQQTASAQAEKKRPNSRRSARRK